jgi:exodeoxyribonuclease III
LKIATWNVNSVNARLERLVAFLGREKPDALCLQELKCEESKFPFEAIRGAGYQAAVLGQKTYNGVAILARQKPEDVRTGFGDGIEDAQSRCLSAVVNGVRVISVYVPNGQDVGTEKYVFKLQWLSRLKRHLEKSYQKSERLVLCGDFNVAPEDRDVHDPEWWRGKILCSEPEREAFQAVCGWGLSDTFRLHQPDKGHYSWWDYRALGFPKNLGLRIDFVLATSPLRELCRSARIDRDERKGKLPSDHAPVLAEFDVT